MPDHDENNHDDHDHQVHGFAMPLPSGLLEAISGERDRRAMSGQDMTNKIESLFDEMTPEQLVILRSILCADNDSGTNNFYDGQIYSILRLVHKVNPWTGRDPIAEFAEHMINAHGVQPKDQGDAADPGEPPKGDE